MEVSMARDQELPIIRSFYDFVLWVSPKIAKFPRDRRFVLGERIERQLYGILDNLTRAKYTRQPALLCSASDSRRRCGRSGSGCATSQIRRYPMPRNSGVRRRKGCAGIGTFDETGILARCAIAIRRRGQKSHICFGPVPRDSN
jgi:hypothetical protein